MLCKLKSMRHAIKKKKKCFPELQHLKSTATNYLSVNNSKEHGGLPSHPEGTRQLHCQFNSELMNQASPPKGKIVLLKKVTGILKFYFLVCVTYHFQVIS